MSLSRRKLLLAAAAGVPLGALALSRRDAAPPPVTSGARVREVRSVIAAARTTDGAGVRLHRALGSRVLEMFDPFLLLDEIQSDDPNDYAAGFPEHPHRGFETVTYMLGGAMEHRDSVGNHGRLGPGSAQWMTAGHGIVHSEMPKQERGLMWGYQLWVNLPAQRKMIPPRYQDIAPERVPEVEHEGARIRVVAGRAFDREGPVRGIDVEPVFLDIALTRGVSFRHALPPGHAAFVYVADGAARIGSERREVRRREIALLSPGEAISAVCDAESARLFL